LMRMIQGSNPEPELEEPDLEVTLEEPEEKEEVVEPEPEEWKLPAYEEITRDELLDIAEFINLNIQERDGYVSKQELYDEILQNK